MFTFIHMIVSQPVRIKAIRILIVVVLALCNFGAFAQNTTIWLVRHAEKSTAIPNDRDPGLTEAGIQRAQALAKQLANEPIANIYSTNYKRTLTTVAPLAAQHNVTPITYDANDVDALVQKVLDENKSKSALIVGHSNTIVPLIKALGASVPFDELNEKDYDFLFKVVIDSKGKAQLTIMHFGNQHHVTEIP